MKMMHFPILTTMCLALTTGCMQGQALEPSARLAIEVAPLKLENIADARYTIAVFNARSEPVWSKTVTSSAYGDGRGSLSYIGPCDASESPNSVTLTLEALWDDTPRELFNPQDYRNPGPVTLTGIPCLPNSDTPVVFNLTIMRPAQQGFFDIAVNFEDVFCSAKVDCKPALLHHGPHRAPTVLQTLACTSGAGRDAPEPTWMFLSDLKLTCVDAPGGEDLPTIVTTLRVGDVLEPGRQGPAGVLFDWVQYQGKEAFEDVDKCYWNHALGLDLDVIGGRVCTLEGTATAGPANLPGGVIAPNVVWPIIKYQVEVVKADGSLCSEQPLDASAGVVSSYVTPSSSPRPEPFSAVYRCGGRPQPGAFACDGDPKAVFQQVDIDGASSGVEVTIGGVSSIPYPLPDGASLEPSCCLASCCQRAP